jgi:hypothetical protein
MKPGETYSPPKSLGLRLSRDEGLWLDALASPYATSVHRALSKYLEPLIKEYKTAATRIIAQRIERSEEWKAIARTCDDWPAMRRILKSMGEGDETWRAIGIHDKDINSRVLTMIIREKYNDGRYDDKKKNKAKNSGSTDGGGS